MNESGSPQSESPGNSTDARERALAEAFAAFNRLSEDLAKSYRELELRVEQLSDELAAARSERLVQLAEKERLANRLSQLLEALPGAVIVTDAEGVVREANPAASEFVGTPLLGERWDDVATARFVGGAAEGGEVWSTGGRRLSLTARALGSEPGEILLLQDVTEARTLQEQLDRHRRLAAMGEMVAGLAHQIRTPLSSVLLYLSHLEQKRLDDQQRARVVDRIRGRVRHLEGMVGDMLQFARGGTVELVPCRLEAVIAEFEELVAVPLAERCASLEISWEDDSLRDASVQCQRAPLVRRAAESGHQRSARRRRMCRALAAGMAPDAGFDRPESRGQRAGNRSGNCRTDIRAVLYHGYAGHRPRFAGGSCGHGGA